MINSEEYLREAFFQEYLTRSKYLAYANQAENEGYPEIAKLYRAAAQGDQVHLLSILSQDWDLQFQR